jgi:hypothetical protein
MGKTRRILKWAERDQKRVILTYSEAQAQQLRLRAPALKDRIFSWRDWKDGGGGHPRDEIGLDDADLILEDIFTERLKFISINR